MTTWSDEARDEVRTTLRVSAKDLYDEAVRVATRHYASQVSKKHVEEATTILRLRPGSSRLGDVFLALGPALAGLGGGVGATVLAADDPLNLEGWLTAGSILLGSVGMALTGAGIALKVRR